MFFYTNNNIKFYILFKSNCRREIFIKTTKGFINIIHSILYINTNWKYTHFYINSKSI